ncbi:MAG: hypothetical protein IT371_24170 [Deltaproteobacteria bacterium]|nr:hypothetical protein [Deltaproteobacteria bacterium]
MRSRWSSLALSFLVVTLAVLLATGCSCQGGVVSYTDGGGRLAEAGVLLACPGGEDRDGDGYGRGCRAGPDCNDDDPLVNPAAREVCDGVDNNCDRRVDEGLVTACGSCDPGCASVGDAPFPLDRAKDPAVKEATGVGLTDKGDLTLDGSRVESNYLWIANTDDLTEGTISKIDTVGLKEVARYYTVTCKSKAGVAGCVDVGGKAIDHGGTFEHKPSRTAVDINFDVWVANRAFEGQASATKIANDPTDCIDRNKNGKIDTSADRDGDKRITTDCDGDGKPDTGATVCKGTLAGLPPEFLGDDDECLLFTVAYGEAKDTGRSICLDGGIDPGPSHAWVGTNSRKANRFYRIHGATGQLAGPYELPKGHKVYGCAVDSRHVLWSSTTDGTLHYFNTLNPTQMGPTLLKHPWDGQSFYGIVVDDKDQVWLGGWESGRIYRYRPNRTSFTSLGQGSWTGVKAPPVLKETRGIAADTRGFVWVAANNGYLWRVPQNVGEGLQDLSGSADYWPTFGDELIGAGVDFKGHVWGISKGKDVASRLDVDAKGNPILPPTAQANTVVVGDAPYTYSDFTGFGLRSVLRGQGVYRYLLKPCTTGSQKATWKQVRWNATTPAQTQVLLRVRTADSETTFGSWVGPFDRSPAAIDATSATPVSPNPSAMLEVEFTLKSLDRKSAPILHDFKVGYTCAGKPD